MQPLQFLVPLDGIDAIEPALKYAIVVLVLINMVTRILAHRSHVKQADEDDDETLSRYLPHTATTLLLVFASFLFLFIDPHPGMVLSVLVVGLFLTDFFEFESRRVEARSKALELERPKAALGASILVLMYAAYVSLFFVIAPVWNAVI
ncbi:hypothetical protein C474_18149 [Halogeometricum pallidum JCM 14848]|uniref:DUF7313 domain-containing protein n=1 Tax=Halogeometricum pallidum JCM 14848 TaxID=1227487 RepID=M0CZG7_HALPD|nr:hypothetical protein [Halogeometricum pallidum]ELZ27294.1 hypothetical protein C474_18149 [Halogeometricum pallidum JCM 14848]